MTLGDTALADFAGIGDAVALDDLIYGEPQIVPAPASAALALTASGLLARRRRRN